MPILCLYCQGVFCPCQMFSIRFTQLLGWVLEIYPKFIGSLSETAKLVFRHKSCNNAIMELTELEAILLERIITTTQEQRQKKVIIDIDDLQDMGYSQEEVEAAMQKIMSITVEPTLH